MTDMERKLIQYKDFLRAAIEAAQISIFELDLSSMHYTRLMNTEAIVAKHSEEILRELEEFEETEPSAYRARALEYFYAPEDRRTVTAAFEESLRLHSGSYYARVRNGKQGIVWCKVDLGVRLEDGKPAAVIGAVSNVDRLMRQSEAYRERAERDSLTQLLNKRYTESCISRIFESNPTRCHALILLDLDNFKQVNDNFGHREGDNVLRACAEHMTSLFRHTDIIGRWGGDEFVVLMTDVPNEEILHRKLGQLLERGLGDQNVTRSMGVAMFPRDGHSLDELFCKADRALYAAKRTKNSYVIYDEDRIREIRSRDL